jgi:hypothetical protein
VDDGFDIAVVVVMDPEGAALRGPGWSGQPV